MDELSVKGAYKSKQPARYRVRESARYIYNKKTGKREIHIDLDGAKNTTAVHEVFHAYFDTMFNQDPKVAFDLAKNLYRALSKGDKNDRAIARKLSVFIRNYKGEPSSVAAEEFLAELAAIMSSSQEVLSNRSLINVVNTIKKFILKTLDRFNIKGEIVEILRQDVKRDIEEDSAIEFIRGFADGNIESSASPMANRLRDVAKFKMDEKSELVQDVNLEEIVDNVFDMMKNRMAHAIDYDKDFHPRAHDLSETGIIDSDYIDIPSNYFYMGDSMGGQSFEVLKKIAGKPDAMVTIYRGIPKNGIPVIDKGAWVSFSEDYAKLHAETDEGNGVVLKKRVKASSVVWGGDDINEFAYYPERDVDTNITPAVRQALADSKVKGIKPEDLIAAIEVSESYEDALDLIMGAKERSQLSAEEEALLSESTKETLSKNRRAVPKSVKEAYEFIKGLGVKAKEVGLAYTETQKKINEFLESMNSQLSRKAFRVRIQARKLRKLADTPQKLSLVEDYLTAPAEAKAEAREKIQKLPKGEQILAVADGMRIFIDSMSKDILNSPYFESLPEIANKKVESYKEKNSKGEEQTKYRIVNTVTGKVIESDLTKTTAYNRVKEKGMKDVIRENLGSYLHTSYRFFKDKNYKISDKHKRAAIAGHYEAIKAAKLSSLIKSGMSEVEAVEALKDSAVMNEMMTQARDEINTYISELETRRKDKDFKYTGLSAKSLEVPNRIFQRKKGLPEYIQTMLGKENDPVNRFVDTAGAMMQTYYKAQLVHKVSQALGTDYIKDSITEEERLSGNWKKMKDPYSPLDGKFVQVEVFEMLQSKPLLQSENAFINYYFKGLKLMRKSKVVWNLPTWRKNWTGGWFFIAANGIVGTKFVSDTKNRGQRLLTGEASAEIEALLDEMAENGLIGADVNAGLIDLNDAALGMMFAEEGVDMDKAEGLLRKIHSRLKNADSKLAEKYASVDDYTKLVIYRVERESFSKKLFGKSYAELTAEQQSEVRREAAEFVKQNTPTFSRLPKWYTKGRIGGKEVSWAQTPMGDFLGFKLESIRSMYANIKNAKEDLEKSKDSSLSDVQRAEYRKAGMRRMSGAISVLGMKAIIPTLFAAMVLDDDDEEIAEDATVLRPSWMEGHSLLVTDISDDGVVSVLNYSMEDPYAELTDPLRGDFSMFSDFTTPNMLLKLAVHLSEGKDAYGRDIYEKADPKVVRMAKMLGYTTKQMVVPPSLVALSKYKNPSQMIMRDYKINMSQQFYFQATEYTSKKKYYEMSGFARKNRLAALDDVREMYEAVMKVAFAKGNMKMAVEANKVLNKFGKIEKAYIITGQAIDSIE